MDYRDTVYAGPSIRVILSDLANIFADFFVRKEKTTNFVVGNIIHHLI